MHRLVALVVALVLGSGVASAAPLPPEQEFTNQTPYGTPDDSVVAPPAGYELLQLQTMGLAMPVVFLLVAAFLLNVVLTRLVAVQRS